MKRVYTREMRWKEQEWRRQILQRAGLNGNEWKQKNEQSYTTEPVWNKRLDRGLQWVILSGKGGRRGKLHTLHKEWEERAITIIQVCRA